MVENKDMYEDIINLPHHVSKRHPQMPMAERAAQYSPFAALTGFGAVIRETERQTDQMMELDENEKKSWIISWRRCVIYLVKSLVFLSPILSLMDESRAVYIVSFREN